METSSETLAIELALLFLAHLACGHATREGLQRAPEEGDQCDPVGDRLHSVYGDKSAFLICNLEIKIFQLHRCDSSDGITRIFDAKRQKCVGTNEEHHWLLMSAPNSLSWKKVGDACMVNRECWDGMYCTGGLCTCYLNYVEVNSICVRVSSTCPGSTYYPEPINGKPKICSLLEPCPPGYVCRPELGGRQGFCCLATANEVCGLLLPHIVNGRPVMCYDTDTAESCPEGHICQLYSPANRRYCCQVPLQARTSSSPVHTVHPVPTKEPDQTPPPAEASVCTPFSRPFTYEGKPVMCIVNDSSSCPIGYTCTMHAPNIHFCCRSSPSEPVDARPTITQMQTTTLSTNSPTSPTFKPPPVPQPSVESICGPSSKPFLYGGNPVMCLLNETGNCPLGYICELHVPSNSHFCCQHDITSTTAIKIESTSAVILNRLESRAVFTPVFFDECPPGQVSHRDSILNETVTCAANRLDSCPSGYFCQWSQPVGKFLCCGINAGCPLQGVAHVNPTTGELHRCGHPFEEPCPAGYTCQKVPNGSHVCCSSGASTNILSSPRLHPASLEMTYNHLPAKPEIFFPTPTPPVQSSQQCPVGSPLLQSDLASGRYRLCSEFAPCPFGYQCLPSAAGPVCCLKSDKVCALPAEPGFASCSFHFPYKAPTPGTRFYYDLMSESCKSFEYSGCDGNANNFLSLGECEQFCALGTCPRGLPLRTNGKAQRCDIGKPSDCSAGYECTSPMIGSVSKTICCPNAGLICNLSPSVGQLCQANANVTSSVTRYYYHAPLGVCRSFGYFGCSGNANNFETLEECHLFCSNVEIRQSSSEMFTQPNTTPFTPPPPPLFTTPVIAATLTLPPGDYRCPIFGQTLHSDPTLRVCRQTAVYPCPDGFTCQKAVTSTGAATDYFVCCGPPTGPLKSQICPNGTDVYVNAVAGQPTICNPADADACPKGYGCVLSRLMRTFYCCSTAITNRALVVEPPPLSITQLLHAMEEIEPECPPGRLPSIYPGTKRPLACQPTSVCPAKYVCVLSTNLITYLCCSEREMLESPNGIYPRSLVSNPFIHRGLFPSFPTFASRLSWLAANMPSARRSRMFTDDQLPHRNPAESNGHSDAFHTDEIKQQSNSLPLSPYNPHVIQLDIDGSIKSLSCNVTEKKLVGHECCAHEQCLHYCANLRGLRFCGCPRYWLLDMTTDQPRCSSSCSKWKFGSFCLPETSELHSPQESQRPIQRRLARSRASGPPRKVNRRRITRT